jgi:hypothetical protein
MTRGLLNQKTLELAMEGSVSLRDFWISVRIGSGLVSPTAVVDSPRLDVTKIQRALDRADLWLTPSIVKGFDEKDFDFLSDDERARLALLVNRFRAIANTVPETAPATVEQVKKARPELQGILDIVRPDKYGDPEALVLGKKLEQQVQGRLPAWVKELRFETGNDASGDPALWIWVEVEDVAAKKDVLTANFEQVRELLEGAVRSLGVERWPYIRLRTVSEQQAALNARKK